MRRRRGAEEQAAAGVGQGGQAPPPSVSRRAALRGVTAGAVVMLVSPENVTRAGTDDAKDNGSWTKGVVLKGGTLEAVTVVVDEVTIVATPIDFPHGWEFRVGDWVGVDLKHKQVCPFLSHAEAVGDGVDHVMPNEVPARSRRVRRLQAASARRPR